MGASKGFEETLAREEALEGRLMAVATGRLVADDEDVVEGLILISEVTAGPFVTVCTVEGLTNIAGKVLGSVAEVLVESANGKVVMDGSWSEVVPAGAPRASIKNTM